MTMTRTRDAEGRSRTTWVSVFSLGCALLLGVMFLPGCLQVNADSPQARDPWIVVTPTAFIFAAVGLGLTSLASSQKRGAVALTFLATLGLLAFAAAGIQAIGEAW